MNSIIKNRYLIGVLLIVAVNTGFAIEADSTFQALEASSAGRLGVSSINTANNARVQYRADEWFPFASTSKVMIVSAVLKQSETNPDILKKQITYTQKDVDSSGYAPITKQYVNAGLTVEELCKASIEYSDNASTNLLIKILGGPEAVTTYARTIHDQTFRLDRWEPNLTAPPGDAEDTTTPNAMVNSLKELTLGDSLASPQREQLQVWLKNNTTGDIKIRAGVPKNWIVGDKTGNGIYGTTNDIAVVWPPGCSPIVMVIYLTQKEKDAVKRDDIIAPAARMVLNEFAKTDQCIRNAI